MKKIFLLISLSFLLNSPGIFSQAGTDTLIYLITCGPGTETYSVYGHTALRVVIPEKNSDIVFNWGVFDFSTPNFVWKFAKGRLDYMLDAATLKSFLQSYFYEQRYVIAQKINLESEEKAKLMALISENIKPENVRYRYDFFYDDCSTRIRDLLEKSIGNKLLYPPAETGKIPTFRQMVGKYQEPYPWLKFGVDLIMGSPGDKKALFRDRMFLPVDMKEGLSEAVVNRSGKMIPLLQNPEVFLDFDPPETRHLFLTTPVFIFTLILVIIIILSAIPKRRKVDKLIDLLVFSVFSALAVLMIFFNFFTDHQQMRMNLNIIWLNPLILFCLLSLILNKAGKFWFRFVFYITGAFLVLHIVLPQQFNISFLLMAVMLLVRSSVRSGFEWNPLSIK
jgi:hypothetical protein